MGFFDNLPWRVQQAHKEAIAGASFVPSGTPVDIASGARPQGWQIEAWRLWKSVGELHAPTTYVARIISRRIGWTLTEGETELEPADAARLLDSVIGPGGIEEFVRLLALNFQVAGEAWIIQGEVGWSVKAVTTPKLAELVEDTRAAGRIARRVYDPDPEDPDKADSSVRAILDSAEDLLTLSALTRAQSRSRIAQAGLLLVPAEQKFDGGDPFGASLEQAMTAAIKDISSPAALSPIKVEMAADLIEKVTHLTFERPYDDNVPEKIEHAIRRIALGLDIPPELLLGLSNSSHWTAWAVQEESYKGTIAPIAEKIAGVIEFVIESSTTPVRVITVEPDPTELLARRSSVRDALDAAKIGAVGLEFVREAVGATDNDAPTPEDLEIIRSLTTRSTAEQAEETGAATQSAPADGDPASPPEA